jgi:hypothetical protein
MFTAIATLAVQTGGDAVMSDIGKRFPFDACPKGKFQVAYRRDVASQQVMSLHYFGTRLICYRGEGAINEFRAKARQSCESSYEEAQR